MADAELKRWRRWAPRGTLALWCATMFLLASSCREPTAIVVEIRTDISCTRLLGTSITAGTPAGIESEEPDVETQLCEETDGPQPAPASMCS